MCYFEFLYNRLSFIRLSLKPILVQGESPSQSQFKMVAMNNFRNVTNKLRVILWIVTNINSWIIFIIKIRNYSNEVQEFLPGNKVGSLSSSGLYIRKLHHLFQRINTHL